MKPNRPLVFRGEPDGVLRRRAFNVGAGRLHPWFFAENFVHAKGYAGRDTQPVVARIVTDKVIDLVEPDVRNPVHMAILNRLQAEYDDWTDRTSGEPSFAYDWVAAGNLYDYEGTGSGERWNRFLSIALEFCDAVRVMDVTDGVGNLGVIWVTDKFESIKELTVGESLVELRKSLSPEEFARYVLKDRDMESLKVRIDRLTCIDTEYRLDQMADIVPPEVMRKVPYDESLVTIHRGLPAGTHIRPGDWVALKATYAREHAVRTGQVPAVESIDGVDPRDVYWAGTDEREFFYLPRGWVRPDMDPEEYLASLTDDGLRILVDGEMARIREYESQIEKISAAVGNGFNFKEASYFHGPDHWNRVRVHGHGQARVNQIDPLIPHLFSLIHDSHREDDDLDPGHGPRAAQWVRQERDGLFSFLSDREIELLARACALHSDGLTHDEAVVMCCWDADRLDLGRVGITPDPLYLCHDSAKDETTRRHAQALLSEEVPWGEQVEIRSEAFQDR